jgi:hypothetical protein
VNAQGLGSLSQRIEAQHLKSLSEREYAVKARDEQLKSKPFVFCSYFEQRRCNKKVNFPFV